MRNSFIQLTSGWIPGLVLILLATALVFGGTGSDNVGTGVRPLAEQVDFTIDAGLELPDVTIRIRRPSGLE
ncbi:MAG: hypothetical protein OEV41_05190 [Gammaproteobacteria bacterium]|nr:hypothetical protein [Gammaproteobacteria bacterium]